MDYFKLKLDRTSIEHRRPSINVHSLLASTNCVAKETISQSANSESFSAIMRDTPCFPMLTILYIFANCLYFHVIWRSASHFARAVDSFVLKRDAHADPEWPESFKKYHTCVFYPPRTTNGIALSNQHRKLKICQSMSRFFSVNPINVRRT